MLELKPLVPKTDRIALREPQRQSSYDPKQRRLMLVALGMLLVALGGVLYGNRDFWFPDTQEADLEQPAETMPAQVVPAQAPPVVAVAKASSPVSKSKLHGANTKTETPKATAPAAAPATASVTANRTVLPPLEVEVIAGDTHRTVRPGSNSVRVDLQPGSPPRAATDAGASGGAETAANMTNNAAERVQMSADTAEVVSHPVNPGYPLLARQMKVQGSVILQALIGKNGIIQDLHVVSGPPILASAAQAAVRQWHFKPHYEGNEAVETQAKITVNFTISTN
ncbi:MAG: energy transducer TonB [Acidobacteriia bacterium]|nr:energy transducer TonB [Terriglobia bacterium]